MPRLPVPYENRYVHAILSSLKGRRSVLDRGLVWGLTLEGQNQDRKRQNQEYHKGES